VRLNDDRGDPRTPIRRHPHPAQRRRRDHRQGGIRAVPGTDPAAGRHRRPAHPHYLQTPIRLRILLVQRSITYPGWAWLQGFQLDDDGALGERRAVFVDLAGLYRPSGTPQAPTPWRR
jgi:hypothetical protein